MFNMGIYRQPTSIMEGLLTMFEPLRLLSRPYPALSIQKKDSGYSVAAEVPGFSAREIEVFEQGGYLIIKGFSEEKPESEMEHNERVIRRTFERRLRLPNGSTVNEEDVVLKNGILTINISVTEPERKVLTVTEEKE